MIFCLLGIVAYLLVEHEPQINSYEKNIEAFAQGKLDGPDKAKFRDALMTMNPITGDFNPRERARVIKDRKLLRTDQARDFQWQEVTSDVAGRSRTMMVDPNDPQKLWVGAATGGLWYSPDFRNNSKWQPVSDDWESMAISALAYDPSNTQIFYAGTGESYTSVQIYRESTSAGVGIYKSTDGGSNWTLLSSTSDFDYINDIVVRDEDGTSVIYVAVGSGRYQGRTFGSTPSDGLYRSADGGTTWTQVLPNIPLSTVPFMPSDIELTADGTLHVGTMRNLALDGGGHLLKSSDGVNWTINTSYIDDPTLTSGSELHHGRVLLKSSPSSPNIVYALASAGEENAGQIRDNINYIRIMRSEDGGDNWTFIEPPLDFWSNIPWHALALDVDPNDPNKILIGALNVYALPDATAGGGLNWRNLTYWGSMSAFSDFMVNYYGLQNPDSLKNHYVHGDIHDIQFLGSSSDEVLFTTDGGVQFTAEMTKSDSDLIGDRLSDYPHFYHVNNGLTTTQYYTAALDFGGGQQELMGGAQDNSTHLTVADEQLSYSAMVSGGDGAYCFFDSDDPGLKIASSQVNNYVINYYGTGYYRAYYNPNQERYHSSGTFINPATYDDRSNLLYANLAVDGGFHLLIPSLGGVFLDQLLVIDVNDILSKPKVMPSSSNTITLGTGSQSAFSALEISPHDPQEDATMVLGNQFGDVYIVTGLPLNPVATKIDNNQLPLGYISGIDIGETNDHILVTFSNYGVQSVWYTNTGGNSWTNLERNLPDIPIRDGIFSPSDHYQIMVASEVGIWGLENLLDENEQWQQYDLGFPNVRVDMIHARESDSLIVAATHGRGLFKGKYSMGDLVAGPLSVSKVELEMFPNPASNFVEFRGVNVNSVELVNSSGQRVLRRQIEGNQLDLTGQQSGLYFLKATLRDGSIQTKKLIIK